MVAGRAAALRETISTAATERMLAGKKNPVANLPQGSTRTRDQIGKIVGVYGKSVDHATRVLAQAIPEVVKAVDGERMAVSTAASRGEQHNHAQLAFNARPLDSLSLRCILLASRFRCGAGLVMPAWLIQILIRAAGDAGHESSFQGSFRVDDSRQPSRKTLRCSGEVLSQTALPRSVSCAGVIHKWSRNLRRSSSVFASQASTPGTR